MVESYELQPAWFIEATRDEHVEHCGDCPVVDMLTELLALRPALAAAAAQATRLEKLEAAARAYVAWLADMEAGRQGIMTGRRLLGTLTAAVAALDAAPAVPGE